MLFKGLIAGLLSVEASPAPEQLHISLAGQDEAGFSTGVRVAWYTEDLPKGSSTVQFGRASGKLTETATAAQEPEQYLKSHGYHHVVPVVGLEPDTRYYYRVGSDDVWSEEWSFKTGLRGEAARESEFSMSIFGDIGYLDSEQRKMVLGGIGGLEKHWSATVSRNRLEALKDDLDLVWIVGDVGYADDAFGHNVLGFTYEKTYNGFMNWMENVSAAMPLMVSPGNHESECHSPGCILSGKAFHLRNFSAYNARFHMPSEETTHQGGHSMWYSFDYGPVHFVSINTETEWKGAEEQGTGDSHIPFLPAGSFAPDGEYFRWLEADLKAASEARAKGTGPRWIVAGGHRQYGHIGDSHVPLFEKYGVDMYFAGHGHSYSRSAPDNGITYIMVGGAGCEEMDASYLLSDGPKEHVCRAQGDDQSCQPGIAAPMHKDVFKTSRMAIGKLDVNASALRWRLYDSADGEVLDEVVVTQPSAQTQFV